MSLSMPSHPSLIRLLVATGFLLAAQPAWCQPPPNDQMPAPIQIAVKEADSRPLAPEDEIASQADIQKLNEAIVTIYKNLLKLDRRLKDVSNAVTSLNNASTESQRSTASSNSNADQKFSELSSQLSQIQGQISQIQATLNQQSTEINSLKSRVHTIDHFGDPGTINSGQSNIIQRY